MQWPETRRCCIINGFQIAALGHAIRKVHKNWAALKLNATKQLPAHADDINSVGKKNTYYKHKKEADLVHIQALSPEHRTKSHHQYS